MSTSSPRRVILITGCSSGIGLATARHFAAKGWLVAASFRDPNSPSATELRPHVAMLVQLDLTDDNSITTAVTSVISELRSLDALANCAGTALVGALERCSHNQLSRALATNVAGPVALLSAALPHLRRSHGVGLLVSSALGRAPLPLSSPYCACKAALDAAAQGAAAECALVNVRVKIVAPGRVTGTKFIDSAEHAGKEGVEDEVYGTMTERALMAMQQDGDAACSSAEMVAESVWNAVTDGKDKIRYIVGEDAKALMSMREALDDEQLRDALIARFELK